MSILALETSTARGSVAVIDTDGALLFEERFEANRQHSSALFLALERARVEGGEWEQIVVGLGPGSYAGVRIAISAALGLSMVSGAELVGIPSVAALEIPAEHYVAIGDARQETFYWTEVNGGICERGPELAAAAELELRLATLQVPLYAAEPLPGLPETGIAFPAAVRLARLARENRGITARGDLEPIYLREPRITRPKAR